MQHAGCHIPETTHDNNTQEIYESQHQQAHRRHYYFVYKYLSWTSQDERYKMHHKTDTLSEYLHVIWWLSDVHLITFASRVFPSDGILLRLFSLPTVHSTPASHSTPPLLSTLYIRTNFMFLLLKLFSPYEHYPAVEHAEHFAAGANSLPA